MSLKNQVNLQSPFERLKSHNTDAYVALLKAIILQAIVDLASKAQDKNSLRYKIDSMKWIFFKNTNFQEICTSAGFETSYVRQIAKDFLEGVIDEEGAYNLILEERARKAMNSASTFSTSTSKTKLTKNQYKQNLNQSDFKQACI